MHDLHNGRSSVDRRNPCKTNWIIPVFFQLSVTVFQLTSVKFNFLNLNLNFHQQNFFSTNSSSNPPTPTPYLKWPPKSAKSPPSCNTANCNMQWLFARCSWNIYYRVFRKIFSKNKSIAAANYAPWNMFRVNDSNARTVPSISICSLYC